MITIHQTPASSSFSGNPMVYRISTDNFLSATGTKAWVWMFFSGIDSVPGSSFNLFYNGTDHVFTTSTHGAGSSGYGLPVADPSWNHNQWASEIFTCLSQNFDLRSHYNIELRPEGQYNRVISLTAKEYGSRWTISLQDITMANLSQSLQVAGEDRVGKTNFGIVASVFDHQSNKIGEDIKSVDQVGEVCFDLSDYFKADFEKRLELDPVPRFRFPQTGGDLLVEHPLFVQTYSACFAEKFDSRVQRYFCDDIRYCLHGGLSRPAVTYYNLIGSDYFSHPENSLRFLATSPVEKVTGKFQGELLYFYFAGNKSPYSYRLTVKVHFSDLTSHSFYATDAFQTTEKVVIECLVGYLTLDLGNIDPSKQITRWDVWLENVNSSVISEVRTFILDSEVREYERTFLFRNSFGCYEIARMIGQGEFTLENKRSSITVHSFQPWTHQNSPNKTHQAWEIQKRQANSGWISAEQNDAFRDLLLTTECYEILDDLLFGVNITSTRIKSFEKDGEYLFSIDMEYERAYNDQFYTANFKPVNMISTEDLTQGVGVIFEASEEITYFGYPKFGTTSEGDATWRIKKMEKIIVSGKPKYVIKWANGDLGYTNIFSHCESLTYGFLSS